MASKAKAEWERFRGGAPAYAAYLEASENRLRSGLATASLREFLPCVQPPRSLRALDIGAGTGAMALRLAPIGVHVTLLDSSAEMLDVANRAAREAGAGTKFERKLGRCQEFQAVAGYAQFLIRQTSPPEPCP